MERITVLSGPSSVGKSTFLGLMKRQKLPSLNRMFRMGDVESWECYDAFALMKILDKREISTSNLVIHYDHNRVWVQGFNKHKNDRVLSLLNVANEIVFITMWESPGVLLRRMNGRIDELYQLEQVPEVPLERCLAKKKLYENSYELWQQYRRWFEFTNEYQADHWIVRCGENVEVSNLTNNKLHEPFWASK